MVITFTEILRPVQAENSAWGAEADVAKIDEAVEDPQPGDGQWLIPAASGFNEQIFGLAAAQDLRYWRSASIAVKLYVFSISATLAIRLRAAGTWSGEQQVDVSGGTAWHTVENPGNWRRDQLDDVAVGIKQVGAGGSFSLDTLYVAVTGSPLFDASDDFASVIETLEPITLQNEKGNTIATTAAAKRLALTEREAASSQGKYTRGDLNWHLHFADPAVEPRPGDRIIDCCGANWTVLEVDRLVDRSRFRCWTRNLAIAEGLDQLITIQQAVWSKSTAGVPAATWRDWRTAVLARIQPLTARSQTNHDLKHTKVTHRIYLAEAIRVDHNMRVVGPDGTIYKIVGSEMPERIDKLAVIEAVQTPWPRS